MVVWEMWGERCNWVWVLLINNRFVLYVIIEMKLMDDSSDRKDSRMRRYTGGKQMPTVGLLN